MTTSDARSRRSTTERSDPQLGKLVNRIVAAMRPMEIWLFGSRAEMRARPTSDYDLLIVMPDDAPISDLDLVRAWRLGWESGVTADIVPCTRAEFEEERNEIDTLARAAWSRGRRVYER